MYVGLSSRYGKHTQAYSFGYACSALVALIARLVFSRHLWRDDVSLRKMLQSIDKSLLMRLRQNWILTSLKQVRFQLVPVLCQCFPVTSLGVYSIMTRMCVLLITFPMHPLENYSLILSAVLKKTTAMPG